MALHTPSKYIQELPPAGGFPAVKYRKVPLQRGPAGLYIVLGSALVTGLGIYRACEINQERKCVRRRACVPSHTAAVLTPCCLLSPLM